MIAGPLSRSLHLEEDVAELTPECVVAAEVALPHHLPHLEGLGDPRAPILGTFRVRRGEEQIALPLVQLPIALPPAESILQHVVVDVVAQLVPRDQLADARAVVAGLNRVRHLVREDGEKELLQVPFSLHLFRALPHFRQGHHEPGGRRVAEGRREGDQLRRYGLAIRKSDGPAVRDALRFVEPAFFEAPYVAAIEEEHRREGRSGELEILRRDIVPDGGGARKPGAVFGRERFRIGRKDAGRAQEEREKVSEDAGTHGC